MFIGSEYEGKAGFITSINKQEYKIDMYLRKSSEMKPKSNISNMADIACFRTKTFKMQI